MKKLFYLFIFLLNVLSMQNIDAQSQQFMKPPKEILDLADIQLAPQVFADKENINLILLSRPSYKSLEELTEEELKLAGIRINPANLNTARTSYFNGISLMEIATSKTTMVKGLPTTLRIEYPALSPQNKYFSFVNVLKNGMELWVIDLKSAEAKKVSTANLSAVMGMPYVWSPDDHTVFARWVADKKTYPTEKILPTGPAIQEATGAKAPARTYQDLLKNPEDEKKFDFYATTSIVKIDVKKGKTTPVLPAGIYKGLSLSPDGKYLLSYEVLHPYSYTLPYSRFPFKVNIYDNNGKFVKTFVEKPLQDKIPMGFSSCENGPRSIQWRADLPASLVYVEAQDEGDQAKEVAFRDKVFQSDAPFNGANRFVAQTINRYQGIYFCNEKYAVVSDFWYKTRNSKTYLINPSDENKTPKTIFDISTEDLYQDPGAFDVAPNQYGRYVIKLSKDGSKMYLQGEGYTPEGNRPFVDEYNIADGTTKRLWQADGKNTYERIVEIMDIEQGKLLTRIESPKIYPNFYVRNFGQNADLKQVTNIENPYKALEKINKEKIYYKREDGQELYATLYTPAGYDPKKDGRLPVLMEAYPTEYKDNKAAGQVRESPHAFVSINWASPLFWVTRGFAILEDTQFPIVGKDKEEPNDTYIPQLVGNARAAIKAVEEKGIGDPKRVAVMGHSYGAFMTANLLAHSDLFAAGIARSGAYNRSLTPFGFQSEERHYWEAQKIYNDMAPFNYADKIKSPILFIHGDADNNPGTFTLQSERMFQAIKGLGGVSRLVLLPNESHGYAAKDNILHMLWEMDSWLEKFVKNKQ
jgi:dipeptidyl aminopeptidase/acylaminoacyl peptidase